MLESYGYKVVEAVDGTDAIAKFIDNRDKIRLIIMDMSMPIMDGPSAIKVIRKLDKHISIIAASAISSPSLKLNVEEDKIFAVMQKPFVLKELLVAISTALKSES
jgi:CheY-like chemotaxis protein